jgi:phosphocarrier protein
MSESLSNSTGQLSREMTILNKHGMHARPAAMLIKTAGQYVSDIYIEKEGNRVSGKSIMGLLTLEMYQGSIITVHAEGPDATDALNAIEELVRSKFNEE